MFRDAIESTPFVTAQADELFSNITGSAFNGDRSFVSSLRALVAPRIPDDERINVRFLYSTYGADTLRANHHRNVMDSACQEHLMTDGDINICNLNNTLPNNTAIINCFKDEFVNDHPGWVKLDKITVHFHKQFNVICFVKPSEKKVILVVDKLDLRKLHFLEISIIAFLPWYFDPKKGITALEMEFVKSHGLKNSSEYLRLLNELAKPYDFRTLSIKRLLAGFETEFERKECTRIRDLIAEYVDKINACNKQLGDYLELKDDLETKCLGLEAKISQDNSDSEIMEYFLCNRNIELESVQGTEMKFVVKSYLEYFNEDLAQRVIDNPNSVIYKPGGRTNTTIPAEDMKRLMTEIFIKQTMKIRFCAAYIFNIRGTVGALGHYNYSVLFDDYMPNPHIDAWSCLGTYQIPINELLQQNNYIGAIEQCAASCRSLNFGDGSVMETFMKRFCGIEGTYYKRKFIELPNGECVTPGGAINWLKEQEGEKDEQND